MLQKYALQLDFACTMLIIDHASTLLYIIIALLSNYGWSWTTIMIPFIGEVLG